MCWWVQRIFLLNGIFLGKKFLLDHSFQCLPLIAGSMLELARLTVDSGWIPSRPVIFLFNGAEELFMLVRITGTIMNLCNLK